MKNIQVASQRGPFQEVRSPKNFSHRHTTGSPEFAKELTVTDDLTVSHTDDDVGDGTYRATCQDEPFGPDSVLNHHAAQFKTNAKDLKGNTSLKRGAKSRYDGSSANDKTDEPCPYGDDFEREEGRPSNATNDLD